MTLNEYFALPDTPAKGSPVGLLMLKIIEKYPDMQPEDAREKANSMIQKAAGRYNFQMPKVHSQEEIAAMRERFKNTR